MQVGIMVDPQEGLSYAAMRDMALAAEAAGMHSDEIERIYREIPEFRTRLDSIDRERSVVYSAILSHGGNASFLVLLS